MTSPTGANAKSNADAPAPSPVPSPAVPSPADPDLPAGPPSERLAVTLGEHDTTPPAVLDDLTRLDVAVYEAIAETSTPTLDEPLRRLSDAANNSKLWVGIAALIAAFGGPTGRRTAVTALTAVAINSFVVNVVLKLLSRRARPDRTAASVSSTRQVSMPTSPSFPSGHAASGFAFVAAVSRTMPGVSRWVRVLAYLVGYSRVHSGVHYPGDVIVGSFIGTAIGETVAFAASKYPWRLLWVGRR